jgi:hypothetical protein
VTACITGMMIPLHVQLEVGLEDCSAATGTMTVMLMMSQT